MAIDTKSFIDDARLKGMSDNAIKSALLNMGVAAAEVNTHFPAFVMQSQPQPQVVKMEEVQPKVAISQEVKPQVVMREQVQPQATAPQGVQLQTVFSQRAQPEPQKIIPQQAQPEIAPLPKGLPTIDSVPGNQPAISTMSATPASAPQGIKETVMQNVGTFGTQSTNSSAGMPAESVVFGNQPAAAPVQPEPYPAGKKKGLIIVGAVAVLILAGGLAYAYTQKLLFFAPSSGPAQPAGVNTETAPSAPEVAPVISTTTTTSTEQAIPSSTAASLVKKDCGSADLLSTTTKDKAAIDCIAKSFENCTPASFVTLNHRTKAGDGGYGVVGRDGAFCAITLTIELKTVGSIETCKFPLALMSTIDKVSNDPLYYLPGQTPEEMSFAQMTLSFLPPDHSYTNPYTKEITKIDCTTTAK